MLLLFLGFLGGRLLDCLLLLVLPRMALVVVPPPLFLLTCKLSELLFNCTLFLDWLLLHGCCKLSDDEKLAIDSIP